MSPRPKAERSYHPASPHRSSPFYDDPLYGHPWQPPERSEEKRQARHRAWRQALCARDWDRIVEMARQVRPDFHPARLEDLDAPGLAVGVCPAGQERWVSGERIGTVLDGAVAVLVWLK